MTPLTVNQERIAKAIIAICKDLRPKVEWVLGGILIGHVIQPAYELEGGKVQVPERRYQIRYSKNYGAIAPALCTSNGSAIFIAQCVRDDSYFVPEPL